MTKKQAVISKKHKHFTKLGSFNEKEVKLFQEFLEFLKQKKIKVETKKDSIPISIFNNNKLTVFEAIIKYFRENLDFSYVKIGSILKRDQGTIGVTYRKAKRKMPKGLDVSSFEISIPYSIFNKKMTVFESLVLHLKEQEFSFNKIASLLKRNYRTIWTVCKRAMKKRANV